MPNFCRRKEVIKIKIHISGNDSRLKCCGELIERNMGQVARELYLLPIPTSPDGQTINKTKESFLNFSARVCVGAIVVGYEIPRPLRAALVERSAIVVDVARDEEYLSANADLTADGTVGRMLTESRSALCDISVGVIGYGRIGQRLVRDLMFFGSRVTVFTSKKELRDDLALLGVGSVDSMNIEGADADAILGSFDFLINTAPARLLGGESVKTLASVRVIELASGDNFPDGLVYDRFSAIPAVMYPKSAGKVLYEAVARMIGGLHLSETK